MKFTRLSLFLLVTCTALLNACGTVECSSNADCNNGQVCLAQDGAKVCVDDNDADASDDVTGPAVDHIEFFAPDGSGIWVLTRSSVGQQVQAVAVLKDGGRSTDCTITMPDNDIVAITEAHEVVVVDFTEDAVPFTLVAQCVGSSAEAQLRVIPVLVAPLPEVARERGDVLVPSDLVLHNADAFCRINGEATYVVEASATVEVTCTVDGFPIGGEVVEVDVPVLPGVVTQSLVLIGGSLHLSATTHDAVACTITDASNDYESAVVDGDTVTIAVPLLGVSAELALLCEGEAFGEPLFYAGEPFIVHVGDVDTATWLTLAPNTRAIVGDVTFASTVGCDDLACTGALPLEVVVGRLQIEAGEVSAIQFPTLSAVSSFLDVKGARGLEPNAAAGRPQASFARLAFVGELRVSNASLASTLGDIDDPATWAFPALVEVEDHVTLGTMPMLQHVTFPVLQHIGLTLMVTGLSTLQTVHIPQLAFVGQRFVVSGNPQLHTIDVGVPTIVGLAQFSGNAMPCTETTPADTTSEAELYCLLKPHAASVIGDTACPAPTCPAP